MDEKKLEEAINTGQCYFNIMKSMKTNWDEKNLVIYNFPLRLWLWYWIGAFLLVGVTMLLNFYYIHLEMDTFLFAELMGYLVLGIILWAFLGHPNTFIYSPIKNWMLENVKCPACDGKIKSSEWRWGGLTLNKFGNDLFDVQCKECNRKFVFKKNAHFLVLVDEIKGDSKKSK